MQKTILIPTDFQVASLNTLKLALKHQNNQEVRVVLMYCEYLSDSITELLFFSPKETIKSLIKPEFEEAVAILKNRFAKTLVQLSVEMFHGQTTNAFQNFAQANEIDEIYIPKSYTLKKSDKSFDPLPYFKKSKLPIYEMEWDNNTKVSREDQLEAIFSNLFPNTYEQRSIS